MDPGNENDRESLLTFFKALADASRLKIVGLLAQKPCSVEQLAAALALRPSTVSHHLSRLARAGLVSAKAEGYYSVYRLETEALEEMARSLLAEENRPALAADLDLEDYDRKVLNTFMTPEGKLRDFPSQLKKRRVLVEYMLQAFAFDRRYSEKEVNQILRRFHEDTASIRRSFIEMGMMDREKGMYWRRQPKAQAS